MFIPSLWRALPLWLLLQAVLQPVAEAQCPSRDAMEALADPTAAFLVLRHEKKGPDERADLDAAVRSCQRRWRGTRSRDRRVVLQEGGLADALSRGRELSAAALRPVIFHSTYCRSLETAIGLRQGAGLESELVEISALDLGTGDLRRAMEAAVAELEQYDDKETYPVVLVTHKDRFADLGLEAPLQGGGYVVAHTGTCLAHLPAKD